MGFNLTPSAMEALARHFREVNGEDNEEKTSTSLNQAVVPLNPGLKVQTVRGNNISSQVPTTKIENALQLRAKISQYIQDGKYEEAHGLAKKQYKLGPAVYFLPVLINFYVCLMQTGRQEKAARIKGEIRSIVCDKLETEPVELKDYGMKLLQQARYFEAILFFQLAGSLHFVGATKRDEIIGPVTECVLGQKLAIMELCKTRKAPKLLLKQHIIPVMRSLRSKLEELHCVNIKRVTVIDSLCLHHIDVCEGFVGDLSSRQATLKEAIQKLRNNLGSEAEKIQLLGTHLHNLGVSYIQSNRLPEAKETLTLAVAAIRKAEDYTTENERRQDLMRAEAALQAAASQV